MTPRRRALVVAPYFTPASRAGGPVRTLAALVPTAPEWIEVDVVTRHSDLGAALPASVPRGEWVPSGHHRVQYLDPRRPWAAARAVVRHDGDLAYFNSFFDASYSLLPQVALSIFRRSCDVLVAPRGELSPGALALKSGKKRALLALYRVLGLHRRAVWHASAAREADEIRKVLGDGVRVIVRENETNLPAVAEPPPAASDGPLRAVFLSRLVPKKGLHVLLGALTHVDGGLELDVYGVEEDRDYVRECRALAARSRATIRFRGAVEPDEVRSVLTDKDVMFFPTDSENFGHVIAEALSVSCPVVLPDTTPWTALVRRGAGTVVEGHDEASWRRAVEAWVDLTPAERSERREAAAACFAEWRSAERDPHVLAMAFDTF